jgi:hypothetical protein
MDVRGQDDLDGVSAQARPPGLALRPAGRLRHKGIKEAAVSRLLNAGSAPRHHTIHRRRLHKATPVQPLGVERQSDPVMPRGFN